MSRRKILSLLLVLVLVVGTFSPAFGLTIDRANNRPSEITYADPNETIRVIVELEEAPILDRTSTRGKSFQELDSVYVTEETDKLLMIQNDVKEEISLLSDDVVFRHAYVRSYNGFSADIKYSAITDIEALDHVKSVHIANRYERPEPQMLTGGGMVNVSDMWNLDYKGEGMLVAVLDTGIDYEHVDFKLTNDANGKLNESNLSDILLNNDLAVEAFAATANLTVTADALHHSAKVPFAFDYSDIDFDAKPDMSEEFASMHGVHVSGTVAANGFIKGIAPEAQIATMKIFSDFDQYAYEDDIVAGIDDAILIGADVINMSLGATAGFTSDEDPEQQAITRAKNAGIIVAVSAGNSARFGKSGGFPQDLTYTSNPDTGLLGSPSAGKDTFSVASIENIMAMSPYTLSADHVKMQFAPAGNADPVDVFKTGPVEYVFCGFGLPADFEGKDLTGKIALISRGNLDFTAKISNAESNGAAGVIVFNNAGESMINMMYPTGGTIPAIFLGQVNGNLLKNATTKTIEFNANYIDSFANPTAGQMSDFSSWGPTPSLEFKPEITAPGGDIYSTVNDNKYESMSGTSMAAPHIAGASAIMLEYVNDKFPALTAVEKGKLAKALMMSTAVPVKINGVEHSPRQQGAGLLDLKAAVSTDVYAYATATPKEAKLALGELDKVFSFNVCLENFSANSHEFAVTVSALTDSLYNGAYPFTNGIPMDLDGAVIKVSGLHVQTANVTTAGIYSITPDVNANTINVFNAIDSMYTSQTPIVIVPVAANSTETVTVSVDLTNIDPNVFDNYYNGFFADGFVQFISLSETDSNPNVNIPYMGFVGEWEDAPIFDDDIYMGNDNAYFYNPQYQSMISLIDKGAGNFSAFFLGVNDIDDTASYNNIAFSPNGDNINDNAAVLMSPVRNAKLVNVRIADANMNAIEYISLNQISYVRKPYLSNNKFIAYKFPTPNNEYSSLIWDGKLGGVNAAEGLYHYIVEASVDGGFGTQMYVYPIFLDLTAPVIYSKVVSENSLIVGVTENHAVKSYSLVDTDGIVVASSSTSTIDITSLVLNDLQLVVEDYAGNTSVTSAVPTPNVEPPTGGGTPAAPTPSTPTPGTPVVTPPTTTPAVTLPVSETSTGSTVTVPTDTLTKQLAATEGETVILKLADSLNTDKPVEIKIEVSSLKELLKAGKSVTFEGKELSFKLNGDITDLSNASNFVITLEKSSVDQYGVTKEYTPLDIVYDFDITIDGIKLEKFDHRPEITITLPADTENTNRVGAYVQNDDGSWTYAMSFYDQLTNTIKFKAPHFSKYALMHFSKTFDDIKGHWAQANIEDMASKHVVSGTTDTMFTPGKTVTRAEFVAMIIKAMGEPTINSADFVDVSTTDWYAGYLAKAKELGLIKADADGKINPLELITREEIATITAKAHAIINNIKFDDDTPNVTFSDAASISSENSKYIGYVQSKNIIVGYNNMFKPMDKATRAEAVSIIKSMLEK